MSTEPPLPIDEDRWLKIKPKVLLSIIASVVIIVGSWGAIKFDVILIRRDILDHSRTLDRINSQLLVIEKEARTAREAIIDGQYAQKAIIDKLDYLTGDRRGPRPATGSP